MIEHIAGWAGARLLHYSTSSFCSSNDEHVYFQRRGWIFTCECYRSRLTGSSNWCSSPDYTNSCQRPINPTTPHSFELLQNNTYNNNDPQHHNSQTASAYSNTTRSLPSTHIHTKAKTPGIIYRSSYQQALRIIIYLPHCKSSVPSQDLLLLLPLRTGISFPCHEHFHSRGYSILSVPKLSLLSTVCTCLANLAGQSNLANLDTRHRTSHPTRSLSNPPTPELHKLA